MCKFRSIILAYLFLASVGCGSKTVINTTPLTEEQKKQIMEDDKRVADEESQGSVGKASKKNKRN